MQVKKLIFVSTDNNNKFYNMTQTSDSQFTVEYGRVGSSPRTEIYPMSKWNSTLNSKLKKGYKDNTYLFVEVNQPTAQPTDVDIKDTLIQKLVNQLQLYANKAVSSNYTVTSDVVTQLMIDEAQSLLTSITAQLQLNGDLKGINNLLLKLYQLIPRKMKNVNNYLLKDLSTQQFLTKAMQLLNEEQSLLDVMAGKVNQKVVTDVNDKKLSLLDSLGISINRTNDSDVKTIMSKLESDKDKYKSSYLITHSKTKDKFDKHLNLSSNKKTDLLWHGSRNQNWWNILQTGLLIRPSCAVFTGAMFGSGIYFASKARKSIGYTSLNGSYWARGNDNNAYLALFDTHLGNQHVVTRADSSLNYSRIQKNNCDSVYAKGGVDLINDEFIVYKSEQTTIKYLIEIGK